MKSFWISFLMGIMLLFSFQNCQKSSVSDELSTFATASILDANAASKLNLSDRKINEVHFISREMQTITKNGKSLSLLANVSYEVLMASGQILIENEQTQVQQTFCLTNSLNEELKSILSAATVCKSENQALRGVVCAQVLQPAYAKIVTDKEILELGAATDSCGSNAIDLCGDSANLLKGFISHIKTQINSLTCQ